MNVMTSHATPPIQAFWCAEWKESEYFCGFRRRFACVTAPASARLHITASGIYRIWVNGVFCGRGPAHSGNEFKRWDEWDIAHLLHAGPNVVAVEVIHFPFRTAHLPASAPGLACRLEAPEGWDGPDVWRGRPLRCYFGQAVRRSGSLGVEEHHDGRIDAGWQTDVSDEGWPLAVTEGAAVWPHGIPRGIPHLREKDRLPAAVVRVAEVEPEEFTPTLWGEHAIRSLAVFLLKEIPEPPTVTRIVDAENLLTFGTSAARVEQPSFRDLSQTRQRSATVILDFGEELAAYFEIDVEGNEGAIVDVAYGEQMRNGRVPALVHQVHYADRYILREGRQTHEFYDWKGFRYVQLTFRKLTRPLLVHAIRAREVSYPVSEQVGFQCSDEQLNAIWRISARSQHLCMQDRYIDCPWREQAPWLLDAYITARNVFGAADLRAKVIEDFAQSQRPDGVFPCASFHGNLCNDQAFTWPLLLRDHIVETADYALAGRYLGNAGRFLDWCGSRINADGVLGDVRPVHLDWSALPKEGPLAIVNGFYGAALLACASIAEWAGDESLAERCRERHRSLARAFHDCFWHVGREYYCDVPAKSGTAAFSQLASAAAVFGELAAGDVADLLTRAAADETLVPVEAYGAFFWIDALTRAGRPDLVLEFIRWRWGNMLAQGATSAWEVWNRFGGYTHVGHWHQAIGSACHGYSGYPATWLTGHLLGLSQLDSGALHIQPDTLGLNESSGTIETRAGMVDVHWIRKNGQILLEVSSPVGCVLSIPEATCDGVPIVCRAGPSTENAAQSASRMQTSAA